MAKKLTRLQNARNGFVQGEITQITGKHYNTLMEADVTRISDQINSNLIDPVIDFVVECDNVLSQSIDEAAAKATRAETTANNADRLAGQAESKARDALTKATTAETQANTATTKADTALTKAVSAESTANEADGKAVQATTKADSALAKATTAESEAARAHTRLNGLVIPNLDTQTWNWLPKSLDSVKLVNKAGVALAQATHKPYIIWTAMRQNADNTKYFLEGRFEARVSLKLRDWYINNGGSKVPVGDLAIYTSTVSFSGISNDRMIPTNIQVNAYTLTAKQHVVSASGRSLISDRHDISLSVVVNSKGEDFDDTLTPVVVEIVMYFQRDAGNFGSGNLFPELRPNAMQDNIIAEG